MYKRILVGTDGSDTASQAVERAVEVAAAFGSRLTILCVDNDEHGRPIVEREASKHAGSGVEITPQVESGDPASVLVELADAGSYDLLVVGNKGMTGVSRFLLGSVPNKVSHHAAVALLIVRTT